MKLKPRWMSDLGRLALTRDEWGEATIGSVLTLEYGKGLKQADRSGEGFPVYGSGGITGLHSEALTSDPTVVVGRKGTAGSVYFCPGPCWVIDTAFYAVPKSDVGLTLEFTRYLLEAANLQRLVSKGGVPGLRRERVYAEKVLIPPLREQQRITDLLSHVDAVVDLGGDYATSLKKSLVAVLTSGEHAIPESYDRFLTEAA